MSKLIEHLKTHKRGRLLTALLFACILSLCMLLFRMIYTNHYMYMFLVWNAFLAFVPLGISSLVVYRKRRLRSHLVLFAIISAWLAFFPNAPYIVTDLLHLRNNTDMPMWFDIVLIVSFAWTALLMGFISLMDIHEIIERRFGWTIGWVFVSVSVIMASFGIYLGRFLRWNTWDIITNPSLLLCDVFQRIIHPFDHPRTYGVTVVFSVFMMIGYLTIRAISGPSLLRESSADI